MAFMDIAVRLHVHKPWPAHETPEHIQQRVADVLHHILNVDNQVDVMAEVVHQDHGRCSKACEAFHPRQQRAPWWKRWGR